MKTWLSIWFLSMVVVLSSCKGFKSSHLDVDAKNDYNINKMILLTALIEDSCEKVGACPESLSNVEAAYSDYLKAEPTVAEKYLSTPWLEKGSTITFLHNSTGNGFHYLKNAATNEYYLYTIYGITDIQLDWTSLELIRLRKYDKRISGLYLTYKGDIVVCQCYPVKGITLKNAKGYMREIKYRALRPFFFN